MLKAEIWQNQLGSNGSLRDLPYEFYAETCCQEHYLFEPKKSRLRNFELGGSQLVISKDSGPKTFQSSLLDPAQFFQFCEANPTDIPDSLATYQSLLQGSQSTKYQKIEQACRRMLLECSEIQDLQVSYQELTKDFLYGTHQSAVQRGQEVHCHFSAQIFLKNESKNKVLSILKGRTDVDSLLSDLEKSWIPKSRLEKALQQRWPSPKGIIQVLWSTASVAKVMLCFIRQLEYFSRVPDEFRTFIRQTANFNFQIIDNWKRCHTVDVEGRPRQETLLFNGPELTSSFNQNSPGFSRRNSYRDFPVTAPWEPAIFGSKRTSQPMTQMENGLVIHDIDIVWFDVKSGELEIMITEAALIHQGQEGENIESVPLRLPISQLLQSFELFSEKSEPHPLRWKTTAAFPGLFVELTAPEAITSNIELQGTVPASYYW